MAMQSAIGKERFKYISLFVGTVYLLAPIGAAKTHNPLILIPMVPLGVLWAFQYDMYYGNMQIRVQQEAARMIKEEPERFFLPEGTGIID